MSPSVFASPAFLVFLPKKTGRQSAIIIIATPMRLQTETLSFRKTMPAKNGTIIPPSIKNSE